MRTPRPIHTRRGITTLIGNGWLHESPKNVWPRGWDIRGRSALRKCMFLPIPPGLKALGGDVSPAAMPPRPKPAEQPLVAHRRNPAKDARLLPAVSPEDVFAAKKRALYADEAAKLLGKAPPRQAWYEDPVVLGSLLLVLPPIGLAALWSSKRYSNDARWALTVMTGLTLCLGAAITIAVIALRA
ncbi:MAG: hypothetical protein KF764_05055 [Labilithrix sp.]|nr:hypothetical protein [Labilithrix sp.]MBX3220897.1 hypothetical protein [Labilithrix sp.]